MVILDSNILVYAIMPIFSQHETIKNWLGDALSNGDEVVGITWQVAASFLRVSTNRRVFDNPLSISDASTVLSDFFDHPMILLVDPTDRHWNIYSELLKELVLSGDIVMDARIAALAIEHGASVVSCDRDFRRFSDHVKIINPIKK